jgi:hypothetical protein
MAKNERNANERARRVKKFSTMALSTFVLNGVRVIANFRYGTRVKDPRKFPAGLLHGAGPPRRSRLGLPWLLRPGLRPSPPLPTIHEAGARPYPRGSSNPSVLTFRAPPRRPSHSASPPHVCRLPARRHPSCAEHRQPLLPARRSAGDPRRPGATRTHEQAPPVAAPAPAPPSDAAAARRDWRRPAAPPRAVRTAPRAPSTPTSARSRRT